MPEGALKIQYKESAVKTNADTKMQLLQIVCWTYYNSVKIHMSCQWLKQIFVLLGYGAVKHSLARQIVEYTWCLLDRG